MEVRSKGIKYIASINHIRLWFFVFFFIRKGGQLKLLTVFVYIFLVLKQNKKVKRADPVNRATKKTVSKYRKYGQNKMHCYLMQKFAFLFYKPKMENCVFVCCCIRFIFPKHKYVL